MNMFQAVMLVSFPVQALDLDTMNQWIFQVPVKGGR